ncbi:hypothetical protein HDV03_001217, partial [Kappamyces sp. JEL0829]
LAIEAGWGRDPEAWSNPTQLTAASSTWSHKNSPLPSPQPSGSSFVDPWAADSRRPSNIPKPPKTHALWDSPIITQSSTPYQHAKGSFHDSPVEFVYSVVNRGRFLLNIKVELKNGRTQELSLYEYDDPTRLATEFCQFWNMNSYKASLVRLLSIKRAGALRSRGPVGRK